MSVSFLVELNHYIQISFTSVNPLITEWALRGLIDFTLSNARRFYSSMGNPLDKKVISAFKSFSLFWKGDEIILEFFLEKSPGSKKSSTAEGSLQKMWRVLMERSFNILDNKLNKTLLEVNILHLRSL